jgi:hypothetical protein
MIVRSRAIATNSHSVTGVPSPPATDAQYSNAIGAMPAKANADARSSEPTTIA